MRVVCDSVLPVMPGGWAILRVTSINDGASAVAWPVRLHPSEATVSFIVDGVRHRGAEQVDSIVETVMLEPGQAISTGVAVSSGDRGAILPDAGTVDIQLVVQPPASNVEVMSNVVTLQIENDAADAEDDVISLDALAWSVRDGDRDDPKLVEDGLRSVRGDDRSWVATALLPAAPLADDVLLGAARRLADGETTDAETSGGADRSDAAAIASAVIDGVPHEADLL